MVDTLNKAKISIIEDSKIHAEWLKIELLDDGRFEIVSVDALGSKGLESVRVSKPDMALVDFQLKDMTGLEVSKKIKTYLPQTKIFMLTAHNEISIIERLISDNHIDAIAIKGSHYFENNFLSAIDYVLKGGSYIEPSLLGILRESKLQNGVRSLTKREFEVFIQSHIGKTDLEIANDLYIELSHVRNLKSKIAKKIKGDNLNNLLSKLIANANPDE